MALATDDHQEQTWTIEVNFEVMKAIWAERQKDDISFNPPLRRLLRLADRRDAIGIETDAIGNGKRFILDGQEFRVKSNMAMLPDVVKQLALRDTGFLECFAKEKGLKRYYCSKNWRDLFPVEQDARRYAQLTSGYWVAKYSDQTRIDPILKKACRAADLQFGVDLEVHYG
jgi:hypothetical protein